MTKEPKTQKLTAVKMAMEQIQKQYGKGSIMKLGDKAEVKKVSAIPTGSIALDVALGIGGLPRGRVAEIYGPEAFRVCIMKECDHDQLDDLEATIMREFYYAKHFLYNKNRLEVHRRNHGRIYE